MDGWTYVIIFVLYFVILSGLIIRCCKTRAIWLLLTTFIMSLPVILSAINLMLAILKQFNALGGFWRILRFCFITPDVQSDLAATSILMVASIIGVGIVILFQWIKCKI